MARPVRSRPATGRNGRRTIAVALDYMALLDDGFEAELRKSIDAHCRALDLNLLLMYGRALDDPSNAAHNSVFDLIHRDRVDGLIVVSTCLASYSGSEGVLRFMDRHAGLPRCSVGVALPGVPSVVIDNRPGMASVIDHILMEHDCRRVAFISGSTGNPEAQLRFEVYRDLLAQRGIAYDPALVANGQFVRSGGRIAMDEILGRGAIVDAVVASNDTMALGAIEVLRERGYHVPGDIPVTGFDDLMLSRLSNPALTTVSQPYSAMTQAAIQVVLEQLAGRKVPECLALPCQLVVRRSCGCNPLIYSTSFGAFEQSGYSPSCWLSERSADMRRALARKLCATGDDGLREADQMLTALAQSLYGRPETFHTVLESMLESAGAENERYRALHDAVVYLRQEFSSVTNVTLESLFCDAISLIAMANTTTQMERRLSLDEEYVRLLEIGERTSLALDLPALRQALSESLPAAGFHTSFISSFPTGTTSELEPIVCLSDGVPLEPLVARFAAHHLVPEGSFLSEQRRSLVVFPLTFETQTLGIAVFEYLPQVTGYSQLRDQISAALRGILLHEEVLSKTMLHERSVQERLAASQRLQALSVLAGGVAHDLNNALGPLVALPDVMLRELSEFEALHGSIPKLSEDFMSIKSAALRASQTIKDLLTLGRHGRTARRAVDLNLVVKECLSDDSLRFLKDVGPNVEIVVELSTGALVVRAAEAQLMRAITNLVRNAVEAVSGTGRVAIRSFPACFAEPALGFETVEPGSYAALSVSDSGVGISSACMGRIFEPFYSSKRMGEQSGTGLGLAIVMGVIKEHEGFIDVASKVGEGTQFTVYLPASADVPRTSKPAMVAGNCNKKVLIVDDDLVQLRTGRRVLTSLGYVVDTLSSGASAYDVFVRAAPTGESPYDLVILDMMLNEDWDGLELLERIRGLFPSQGALIASGHAPGERVQNALERGLTWLVKPYTVQTLTRALVEALDGTR